MDKYIFTPMVLKIPGHHTVKSKANAATAILSSGSNVFKTSQKLWKVIGHIFSFYKLLPVILFLFAPSIVLTFITIFRFVAQPYTAPNTRINFNKDKLKTCHWFLNKGLPLLLVCTVCTPLILLVNLVPQSGSHTPLHNLLLSTNHWARPIMRAPHWVSLFYLSEGVSSLAKMWSSLSLYQCVDVGWSCFLYYPLGKWLDLLLLPPNWPTRLK